MLIRFWGTRGSLPAPLGNRRVREQDARRRCWRRGARSFDSARSDRSPSSTRSCPSRSRGTYGGNSSCVEIVDRRRRVCAVRSGLRRARVRAAHAERARAGRRSAVFNVFMSHVHWDHIMGFPFFTPAYIPGNVIRIHGCHKMMREAFMRQQSDPCFPVDFDSLGATIEFVELEPGRDYEIAGLKVRADPAEPCRRFLRLSLRAGRQDGRLFDRLRAQVRGARRELSVRRLLPRRRPVDLRRACTRSPTRSR